MVVNSMLARLSRLESPSENRSQVLKQQAVRKQFAAVIFAAGKSTRMEKNATKMLMPVSHLGKTQAMLFHVIDLFTALDLRVVVLVGFDGKVILQELNRRYGIHAPKTVRVANDNGADLMPNTAGTLKKYSDAILKKTEGSEYLLFTVGDQPFMRPDSINDFILDLLERSYQAGILLADATGTYLEKSTSTRVSIAGDHSISFATPTRESRWELQSSLLDVGILILHRSLLTRTVAEIPDKFVFSRVLEYLPKGQNTFLAKIEPDVMQFRNINSIVDVPVDMHIDATAPDSSGRVDNSGMILAWLRWNSAGRPSGKEAFNIFDYSKDFPIFCEMDTTTECNGTLGCTEYCTYKNKHAKGVTLDSSCGRYFLDKATDCGIRGVLFSGGGENLEECSYDTFLALLRYAKQTKGLNTSLATNGKYLTPNRIEELSLYLDSIRISVPPIYEDYCHAGIVAPHVTSLRRVINNIASFRAGNRADEVPPICEQCRV